MSSADAQNIDPARYAILVKDYIEAKRGYDLAKEALQPGEPTKIPAHGEPMKLRCGHVIPTPKPWADDEIEFYDEICPLCAEEGVVEPIWPYQSPTEEAYERASTLLFYCKLRLEDAVFELLNGRTRASMLFEDSDEDE